jgi:hypothetical protein
MCVRLEARLKARRSCRDPKDLQQHLSIVEEKKRALTRYAELINEELLPIQSTTLQAPRALSNWFR